MISKYNIILKLVILVQNKIFFFNFMVTCYTINLKVFEQTNSQQQGIFSVVLCGASRKKS